MLKSTAKQACVRMAKMLPWGGRRAVLDALLDDFGRRQVFAELGQQLRVESVAIKGANGTIRGSIEDVDLLGRYAAEGSWAEETIRDFQQLFEHSGGSFLDIGANIGLTTIPIARNPDVQCYSFE